MGNDSVGVAAAGTPTNYIDNESISTGGSPATVDRQRVRVGGAGYTDLADVLAGDTGQSSQVVVPARKEVSFTTTTNQPLAVTDCSNYRYVCVILTALSGTLTAQTSNDNSAWVNLQVIDATNTGNAPASNVGAVNRAYVALVPGRYFRLNQTAIGATTTGVVEFVAINSTPKQLVAIDSGTVSVLTASGAQGDAVSDASGSLFDFRTRLLNGSSWDRQRTPTKFFTATATASGDTALWTPTSGKKFRLMRYKIEVTGDAATASGADIDVLLRDSTTALGGGAMSLYVPAAAATTNPGMVTTGWVDLGNGQLSALANNALNVNLSAALTAGKLRVVACGTEE